MSVETHLTAPTRYVEAQGVRYAYRKFSTETGTPPVFLQHFRGGMDNWDPAVTDGLGALSAEQDMVTPSGMQPSPVPCELSADDIETTIADFRRAAAAAIEAGADGVEIHGANGYLLHQFLSPNANHRTDSYGGSVENRSRIVVDIARAVSEEIGADRTGSASHLDCRSAGSTRATPRASGRSTATSSTSSHR